VNNEVEELTGSNGKVLLCREEPSKLRTELPRARTAPPRLPGARPGCISSFCRKISLSSFISTVVLCCWSLSSQPGSPRDDDDAGTLLAPAAAAAAVDDGDARVSSVAALTSTASSVSDSGPCTLFVPTLPLLPMLPLMTTLPWPLLGLPLDEQAAGGGMGASAHSL